MEVLSCRRCPLHASRNKPVFGEGDRNAEIFVIGEAPGREEDMAGRPFVGLSGVLLDKIFSACGFTRTEHLYIGNIIKCRPPGNRTPLPGEVSQCLPYLHQQIEWINPSIIVLLGALVKKFLNVDPWTQEQASPTGCESHGHKQTEIRVKATNAKSFIRSTLRHHRFQNGIFL